MSAEALQADAAQFRDRAGDGNGFGRPAAGTMHAGVQFEMYRQRRSAVVGGADRTYRGNVGADRRQPPTGHVPRLIGHRGTEQQHCTADARLPQLAPLVDRAHGQEVRPARGGRRPCRTDRPVPVGIGLDHKTHPCGPRHVRANRRKVVPQVVEPDTGYGGCHSCPESVGSAESAANPAAAAGLAPDRRDRAEVPR